MLKLTKNRKVTLLLALMLAFFTVWWLGMSISHGFKDRSYVLLSEVYGLIALVGGLNGLREAKGLGSLKSHFGRAIIFLALGLLLQEFGQLAYSYFNSIAKVELPYPAVPDIGFFGSIPMYIIGAYYLMKGLGVVSIIKKSPIKLLISIAVSASIVGVSYWLFLKGYDTADRTNAAIFFDFAYPLAQTIYVSIAVTILISVGGLLGGMMRKPVLLLLSAFLVQYAADSNFLYQTIHGTWGPAGYGDYIYMSAYFLMSLSLIYLCAPIIALRSGHATVATTSESEETEAE